MNESILKKCLLCLSVALIFSAPVSAQIIKGKKNKALAEQAILTLHDGALVIRLKSKRNKITKLEELLAKPDIKESDAKKLRKELERTISERDEFNNALAAAFEKNYTFSGYYFIYDTASVALKNGEKSGFFLDENLEVDPKIQLTQDSFFLIYNGTLDATDRSGMEALIILDRRFEVVPAPFPYYTRVNSFWRVFERVFSPRNAIKKDAYKIVAALNKNLKEYFQYAKIKHPD